MALSHNLGNYICQNYVVLLVEHCQHIDWYANKHNPPMGYSWCRTVTVTLIQLATLSAAWLVEIKIYLIQGPACGGCRYWIDVHNMTLETHNFFFSWCTGIIYLKYSLMRKVKALWNVKGTIVPQQVRKKCPSPHSTPSTAEHSQLHSTDTFVKFDPLNLLPFLWELSATGFCIWISFTLI